MPSDFGSCILSAGEENRGRCMQLETTRFGSIDLDTESVITFTQPIIGFQEFRRFVVMPGPEGGCFTWLQSTDSGELAFLMMDPTAIIPEYTVELRPAELEELAVSSPTELESYTLVSAAHDRKEARTNLKAPILINRKDRLAKQTILEKSNYSIRYYLNKPQPGTKDFQGVHNARTNA